MPADVRILELVERVLEQETTAEVVCADCPELLAQVKERLEWCERIDAQLAAIFPSTQSNRDIRALGPMPIPEIPGYTVLETLGRGGIGIVYRARQLTLDREVALKMLLAGEFASAIEQARFMREARTIAGLRHPNIVQIFDFGDHNGRPFFTMELLEGGTLAEKLDGRTLPPREAATLLATLAETMHAAHRVGIVHRDLKPANVMLTPEGTPKISDFGLARQLDGNSALTLDGAVAGTPSYMSPEQVEQTTPITASTDIYSLGAMLYEMLTGKPPFVGETSAATQRLVIEAMPVPPSQRNSRTPRDLETICLKCLEKSPAKRYESAAELADDLYRFVRGEPVHARRANVIERFGKWVHRRPGVAATLAAILLVSLGVAYGMGRYAQLQSQRRQAIEADLTDVAHLERLQKWDAAQMVLVKAEGRFDDSGSADLRRSLTGARQTLDLVTHLDSIHLSRVTGGNLVRYRAKADKAYREALVTPGVLRFDQPPEESVRRIKQLPISSALLAALDDWAMCSSDMDQRQWLLKVAHAVDPSTSGDADPVRELVKLPDNIDLAVPARALDVRGQPTSALLALGEKLNLSRREASEYLKRVQAEHPADFWANLALGDALLFIKPAEASVYYRAALAARPAAAIGYCVVGDSLLAQHQSTEALVYFDRALAIDPNFGRGWLNRGRALQDLGRSGEAPQAFNRALQADPDYAWAHFELAKFEEAKQNWPAAAIHYREIAFAAPHVAQVQTDYRLALFRAYGAEGLWNQWKIDLQHFNQEFDWWNGYAELSLYLGKTDEYRRVRTEVLKRFGDNTNPRTAEPIARMCLLLADDSAESKRGVQLAEQAASAERLKPSEYAGYTYFVEGLAAFRTHKLDRAIELLSGDAAKVMGPCPNFIIAMALQQQGHHDQAQQLLTATEAGASGSDQAADRRDEWIKQILHREAIEQIRPQGR